MRALWDLGEGTVTEIRAALRTRGVRVARTTVATLLERLEVKGAVRQGEPRGGEGTGRASIELLSGDRARDRQAERAGARGRYCLRWQAGSGVGPPSGRWRLTHDDLRALRELLDDRLKVQRAAKRSARRRRSARRTGAV